MAAALVGIYWMSAAIHGEPSKAYELGGVLQEVEQNKKGMTAKGAAASSGRIEAKSR